MKFIDLFCGIGGFRLALEKAGHQCIFSSEIDQIARDCYSDNFFDAEGKEDMPYGDITKIEASDIPEYDILCAGFPCQPFSQAGDRKGFEDARGTLIWEVLQIVRDTKPKIILLENVAGILSLNKGSVVAAIDDALRAEGYDVHRFVLNSADFGVPQARKRVYWVCLRKGFNASFESIKTNGKVVILQDILEKNVDEDLYIKTSQAMALYKSKTNNPKEPKRVGYYGKGSQAQRVYSTHHVAITQSALGGGWGAKTGLYLIDNRVRRLSVLESKRVMGFPDNFELPAKTSQAQKLLGNAVVPAVIEAILGGLIIPNSV